MRRKILIALTSIAIGSGVVRAAAEGEADSLVSSAVTNDDLAALANDVNLAAWSQLAVSREFTTIDQGWVAVYSPRDAVGAMHDWNAQVNVARSLAGRTGQADQRHWLALFIQAGEAVARQDAPRFAAALRAIETEIPAGRNVLAVNHNFFTAK